MPKLKKYSFIKTLPLCLGVLVLTFALSYLVSAWTEPTELPPGGNVDTPLNVGPNYQYKEGGLLLNLNAAPNGLIVLGEHTNFVDGNCPAGCEWYDDGDLVKEDGECVRTSLSVDKTGKIGVNTSAPAYTLDVNGDLNLRTSVLRLNGATGTAGQVLAMAADGSKLEWKSIGGGIEPGPKGYVLSSDGTNLVWVSSADLYILMLPLVKGLHTGQQCIDTVYRGSHGEIVDTDVGQKQCRFTIPYVQGDNITCPPTWNQYRGSVAPYPLKDPSGKEYSGYSTCVGYKYQNPNDHQRGFVDCGPDNKAWGNGGFSDHSCVNCYDYQYSDCPMWVNSQAGCGWTYATRIQIGCY